MTNLYLLTRVIDAGGFAAAARELGTTRSLLSRRVIALEKALGTQLLYRNARRFAVTSVGEKIYGHAITMCEAAHAAVAAASEVQGPDQGMLRISMRDVLLPLVSNLLTVFAERYPQMQLATHTHRNFDILLYQHADVVLHLGSTLPDSGDIVARPLGQARLVIVGSPALLEKLGRPRHPDNIDERHCLGYTGHGLAPEWTLRGAKAKHHHSRLVSDNIAPMVKAACAGMGLVQLPMYACHNELANGRLETVFGAFEAHPLPLYALTLAERAADEATLGFVRFARKQLGGMQNLGILPL